MFCSSSMPPQVAVAWRNFHRWGWTIRLLLQHVEWHEYHSTCSTPWWFLPEISEVLHAWRESFNWTSLGYKIHGVLSETLCEDSLPGESCSVSITDHPQGAWSYVLPPSSTRVEIRQVYLFLPLWWCWSINKRLSADISLLHSCYVSRIKYILQTFVIPWVTGPREVENPANLLDRGISSCSIR